jgi:hypothetical protein
VILAVFLIAKRRRVSNASAIYVNTMKALARKGIIKGIHPWQEENMVDAVNHFPSVKVPLLKFMDLYLKARFDPGHGITLAALESARLELLQQIDGTAFPSRT